jgi:hypothetical protein
MIGDKMVEPKQVKTNNQAKNVSSEQAKHIPFLQSDFDKQADEPEVPKKTAIVKHEVLHQHEQEQPDIS